jgi:hypothetical protein
MTRAGRLRAYIPGTMGNIINQRKVSIDLRGPNGHCVYTVWSGVIRVSTELGRKAVQVGGSGSPAGLDGLAPDHPSGVGAGESLTAFGQV